MHACKRWAKVGWELADNRTRCLWIVCSDLGDMSLTLEPFMAVMLIDEYIVCKHKHGLDRTDKFH